MQITPRYRWECVFYRTLRDRESDTLTVESDKLGETNGGFNRTTDLDRRVRKDSIKSGLCQPGDTG